MPQSTPGSFTLFICPRSLIEFKMNGSWLMFHRNQAAFCGVNLSVCSVYSVVFTVISFIIVNEKGESSFAGRRSLPKNVSVECNGSLGNDLRVITALLCLKSVQRFWKSFFSAPAQYICTDLLQVTWAWIWVVSLLCGKDGHTLEYYCSENQQESLV